MIASDAIRASDISVSYFVARLEAANSIDFSDDFFQASGTGRTRIRKSIEFAIGINPKTNYAAIKDGETYQRLVGD